MWQADAYVLGIVRTGTSNADSQRMPSRGISTCTYSRSEESALYAASERVGFVDAITTDRV